MYGEEMTSC